jgi:hypothetical protein
MRKRLRTAALLTIVGALTAGAVTSATAAPPAVATWNADLASGDAVGVAWAGGAARLDLAHAVVTPLHNSAAGVPTGLLTLPARRLDTATDHVGTSLVADVPAGSTASVDIRGLRRNGNWTEWIPAAPWAALPEPVSQVQARLVLTSENRAAVPTVRGVTLSARPAAARPVAGTESAPLRYKVFATREGLAGGTTANGHVISDRDHFVALPSRRALSPKNTSDYSVKVCAANGRCAFAPVWDVGPWNTRDDYWNPATQRQQWADLPQGVPAAQAAYRNGYNGGRDQYDRQVANPAGIDLADGVFWDALGLEDNGYVTVDYLWTGDARLSAVAGNDPVNVLAAPDVTAEVVGVAAEGSAVPVQCALTTKGGSWLQIGTGEFVLAAAVPQAGPVTPCAAPSAPVAAAPTTAPATASPAPKPASPTTAPIGPKPAAPAPTATGSSPVAEVSAVTSQLRARSRPWTP